MQPRIATLAAGWLILLAAFFYGIKAAENNLWPYPDIRRFEAFVRGDAEETSTITEKIQNDLGLAPARHLVPPPPVTQADSPERHSCSSLSIQRAYLPV